MRHLFALLLLALQLAAPLAAQAPVAARPDAALQATLERITRGFGGDVGVYVRHLRTGASAEIRADETFPTASMIKVPLMLTLYDRAGRGLLDLSAELPYPDTLKYQYEGITDLAGYLEPGEKLPLAHLAFLMVALSDNVASLWIQALVGGGAVVNEWLAAHGYERTRVNSRTPGREEARTEYGWGQTTPREIARMLVTIREGRAVSPRASEDMYRLLTKSHWDDEALSQIPPTVQAASKQGAVDRSRSEVLLVNAPTGDYVLAVITKNQRDTTYAANNEGHLLIRSLSRAVYEHFNPDDRWRPVGDRAAVVQDPAIPFGIAAAHHEAAERLMRAAMRDSAAWNRVAELSDRFGSRFSGSPNLERAIDWILAEMREDGLENVRGEPVMVPRWVRGQESAELLSPRAVPLHMLGLGGSVGTPTAGISADVLVVGSFEELTRRAAEARGKIVLFDVPFTAYGETVLYRTGGASAAARVGAVAALVRSVGPFGMQTPHTGSMTYDTTIARIPTAAISMEDAMMLRRMRDRGERVRVRLRMEAKTLPDAPSRNVVAELRGRELPDEVIVIGGHIDSWDVGTGAMDDAGGSVAAWEAVRLMKELGLRPRRTIRVVLWTNEENGTAGAKAYRDQHRAELANHVLAIESDGGVFAPRGFTFTGPEAARAAVGEIVRLLEPIGATAISPGSGGADVEPLEELGVPGMGLLVDPTRYFWYHHTHADTPDKLDPAEVARCVAAMAVLAYVVAEMPERLPSGTGAP